MSHMARASILRRLREKKTNYRKRRGLLMSKSPFITVNITNENAHVQVHKAEMRGDKVIASAHSRYLISKGWKGSRKNIAASYITGYLAGKKAAASGTTSAILYSGTRPYTQRMAAALKGVVDAGLDVPASPESFPPKERLEGTHLSVKNDVAGIKSMIDSEVAKV